MEQLLNEMIKEILNTCEEDNTKIEHICDKYLDKILALIPKPISVEVANYSNETSYINRWNACLEKMNELFSYTHIV